MTLRKDSATLVEMGAVDTATLSGLGVGLSAIPTLPSFDFQQADLLTAGTYRVSYDSIVNIPVGVAYNTGTVINIRVLGASSNGARQTIELIPDTTLDTNYKIYEITVVGAKGSRNFTVRQIWSSAIAIPVTGGGTGATTAETARTNLGLDGMGIGVSPSALSSLDWQTYDFVPGSRGSVVFSAMTNTPASLSNPSTTATLQFEVTHASGTSRVVSVKYGSTTQAGVLSQSVIVNGTSGARTFLVLKHFTDADTIPVANGGTGATTAAAARTNLGLKGAAVLDVGTSAGTVAAGNDARLVNAASQTGSAYSGVIDFVSRTTSGDPGEAIILRAAHGVSGTGTFENTLAKMFSADGSFSRIQHWVDSTHNIRMVIAGTTGGTGVFTFSQTGTAVASGSWVNSGSDERIKDNITPIQNPREILMDIRAATWNFKHKGADGRFGIGVIANDIAKYFPDAVHHTGDRQLDDGSTVKDVLAVEAGDSGAMVAIHHSVLQSLVQENEAQQKEIDSLKSELKDLREIVENFINK